VLRRNVDQKIRDKHNVTWATARAASKHGKSVFVAGTKWQYTIKVQELKCNWLRTQCKKTGKSTTVLTSIDFRKVTDKRPYGVVTTYCVGIQGKCPDYVKKSLNT
jgi:hypothetical protein